MNDSQPPYYDEDSSEYNDDMLLPDGVHHEHRPLTDNEMESYNSLREIFNRAWIH